MLKQDRNDGDPGGGRLLSFSLFDPATSFGCNLCLACQVIDDILDVTPPSTEVLGKGSPRLRKIITHMLEREY